MISQMFRNKAAKQSTKLFTPGNQKRDWVYVDDVVQACWLAMNKLVGITTTEYHDIFNVGSGTSTTFNDLAKAIYGHYTSSFRIEYVDCPFEKAYQSYTECDLTKIKEHLGYEPQYNLHDGIEEYKKTLLFHSEE